MTNCARSPSLPSWVVATYQPGARCELRILQPARERRVGHATLNVHDWPALSRCLPFGCQVEQCSVVQMLSEPEVIAMVRGVVAKSSTQGVFPFVNEIWIVVGEPDFSVVFPCGRTTRSSAAHAATGAVLAEEAALLA